MRFFTYCAIALCAVGAQTVTAQAFKKGDIVADLNLGVGIARTVDTHVNSQKEFVMDKVSKTVFSQRIGLEFGVCDFSDKASLGVGFSFANGIFSNRQPVSGNYDYEYQTTNYHRGNRNQWEKYQTQTVNRKGSGTALAKNSIDDLSLMARVAFHYTFLDRLDTYVGIGFGLARLSDSFSDFSDMDGFSSKDEPFDPNHAGNYQICGSYNDLDHVKWDGGTSSSRYAVAAYLGARYYIADNYGVNVELGLPNVTLKKHYNHFDIFSVGFSYKF